MNTRTRIFSILCLVALVSVPFLSFAYQQPLVAAEAVIVDHLEQPKAYFGKLEGTPHIYHLESMEPFHLYVSLFVPNTPEGKRDIMATIMENGSKQPLALLDGTASAWEESDTVGPSGSPYIRGPVFDRQLEPGIYEIHVSNPNNDGAYGLRIGEPDDDIPYPGTLSVFISLIILGLIIWAIVWGVRKRTEENPDFIPAPAVTESLGSPAPVEPPPANTASIKKTDTPPPVTTDEILPTSGEPDIDF